MKVNKQQETIFPKANFDLLNLNDSFFDSHLITYIGNKRRLRKFLFASFSEIKRKIGKDKLIVLDGFSGSGAVSRVLKAFAEELHVNDLEDYCETLNNAYLTNKSDVNQKELKKWIDWLNNNKLTGYKKPGFIEANYSPKDDNNVQQGERVFYTNKNAKIIDNLRRLINEKVPEEYRVFCLASLLVQASIHTNTSGVFKGFHKRDGLGHFGGKGENALQRIKAEIQLDMPVFSEFECKTFVTKRDVNELVFDKTLPVFDLAYYDPPYNQHPYGSNYFMLNIINHGQEEEIQDGVSGISKNWNRSAYNKRKEAEEAMAELIKNTRAKYIAISYNNEGLIPIETFKLILSKYGDWSLFEQDYNTYRGSRNLKNRDIKVKEMLWVIKKF